MLCFFCWINHTFTQLGLSVDVTFLDCLDVLANIITPLAANAPTEVSPIASTVTNDPSIVLEIATPADPNPPAKANPPPELNKLAITGPV